MPRPIPLQSRPSRQEKRSLIYRPYVSQTIHDPTKAFRDSSVVYLSDLKIYRECRPNSMYGVAYGTNIKNIFKCNID